MHRINEIDYVKSVMIVLMIAFHLVFIGNTYPAAKEFVYTFHMPCFLIISGYLMNCEKPVSAVVKSMMWIALPYAIMETAYIGGAMIFPIKEHIDHLTITGYLDMLVLHPIGPYWYLQTLVLCTLISRIMIKGINSTSFILGINVTVLPLLYIILIGTVFFIITSLGVMDKSSCLYFIIGMALRQYNIRYEKFFRASVFSVLLLAACAVLVEHPDRFTPQGILMVWLATSSSVFLHNITQRFIPRLNGIMLFIGRNTLLLLLFSPLFTILAKTYQPFVLSLDPTGMVFLVLSLIIAIAGSLTIGYISDRMRISPYIFGKNSLND